MVIIGEMVSALETEQRGAGQPQTLLVGGDTGIITREAM